jgi:dihydroxyacid dehydratase/phosphogluconate dehydratase
MADQKKYDGKTPATMRSRAWFDNPGNPDMTALYLERYLNFGLTREELQSGKPIIGIAQTGSDLSPCNRHHIELAKRIREGIREAGGIAMEFPVHPIQETGKRPGAALDRNLAYLGLVELLYGYPLDGVVLTIGCDKTTPACLMAAATLDIPAIAFSVGPMLNGWHEGERTGSGTIVWKAREMMARGELDYRGFMELVASSAPSVGYCNTMGTASTMNSLAEALGMQLPGSASIPAPYRERGQMAYATGLRIVDMVREDLRPSKIMTKDAFHNAIVVNSAIGGSTNAPIHICAIARHMGVESPLQDWQTIGHKVPLLVNLQPAGEYLSEDFHHAGGVPAVVNRLMEQGLIKENALTANGKTMGDNCRGKKVFLDEVIWPFDKPMKKDAGFIVLKGNLFDSAIVKTSVIQPGRHRAHHPDHARRRTHRLPRRGGSCEHAPARLAAEGRCECLALRRRWPPVGHLGFAVHPECLAGSRRHGRPGAAADRRPGAHRPEQGHREHAGGRCRTGQAPQGAGSRRRLQISSLADPVAGNPARHRGPDGHRHGAGECRQVPEDRPDVWDSAGQSLSASRKEKAISYLTNPGIYRLPSRLAAHPSPRTPQ